MKKQLTILAIIGICWVIGTIGISKSSTLDKAELIFLSIGGFGVIAVTFFNIWNSWETSKNIVDRTNFDKTENSFRYLERWDWESLKKARDLTRDVKKKRKKMSDEELKKLSADDKELERSVITIFNFWEEMCLSIR